MPLTKVSELDFASFPLVGDEVTLLVQGGVTRKASINTLTVLISYTVAGLPAATTPGMLVYVSNESGGAVPAFADGTNWRRVTDRAIVS
jgi:hypothetical protein